MPRRSDLKLPALRLTPLTVMRVSCHACSCTLMVMPRCNGQRMTDMFGFDGIRCRIA